jgi:hypothetical protein
MTVQSLRLWGAPITALPVMAGLSYLELNGTHLAELELEDVGSVNLMYNPELRSVRCGRVFQDVRAANNDALQSFTIRDTRAADGTPLTRGAVSFMDNKVLTDAPWLADLHQVASLNLQGNPNLIVPASLDLVVTQGHIALTAVPTVRELTAELTDLYGIHVVNTGLRTLHAVAKGPAGARNPWLRIRNNADLTTVAIEARLDDNATIQVHRNAALTSLALQLTSRAYELTILDNPHLPACVAQAILDRIEARHEERQSGNDDNARCP